jgi:Malectin-like domain
MYDRWWTNYTTESWTEVSTNSPVVPSASYQTPSLVMKTAATTSSTKVPLAINGSTRYGYYYKYNPSFLLVLHFAEIKNLSTDRREFRITTNGEQKFEDYIPRVLASDSKSFSKMGTTYISLLEATPNSTLPPLLNAIELYQLLMYPTVPTDNQDGNFILESVLINNPS